MNAAAWKDVCAGKKKEQKNKNEPALDRHDQESRETVLVGHVQSL